MVEGVGPFDTGLRTGAPIRAPANFADKLKAAAEQHGWTLQMAWFRQGQAISPTCPSPPSPRPARPPRPSAAPPPS